MEIAAPNDGVLKEIIKENGADVKSGELIARVETTGSVAAVPPAEKQSENDASTHEQQTLPVLEASQIIDTAPINKESNVHNSVLLHVI